MLVHYPMGQNQSVPQPVAPETKPATSACYSASQKLPPEPRAKLNSARSKIGDINNPVTYGGSGREHPGRIMTPNRRIGAVRGARPKSTTGGRARPKVPMHGDAQLKLNLEGLNGYAAMMATMKEMGYESEGEQDEETGKPQESPSLTSQSANANAPNAAAANAKKQGKKKKEKTSHATAAPSGNQASTDLAPSRVRVTRMCVVAIIVTVVLLAAGGVGVVVWLATSGQLRRS